MDAGFASGNNGEWLCDAVLSLGPFDYWLARLSLAAGDQHEASLEADRAIASCERAGLTSWRDRVIEATA